MLETRKGLGSLGDDVQKEGESNFLVLQKGANQVRMLPFGYLMYHVHYLQNYLLNIPAEELEFSPVVACLKNYKKPCPVCTLSQLMYNSDSEKQKETAGVLYHKKAYLFPVLVREGKDAGTLKILRTGVQIAEQIEDLQKRYGDPTDPDEGYDIVVNLSVKADGYNHYKVEPLIELGKDDAGKKSMNIVLSPLTKEEKQLKAPAYEDFVVEPDEGVLEAYFGPIIAEEAKAAPGGGGFRRSPVKPEKESEEVEEEPAPRHIKKVKPVVEPEEPKVAVGKKTEAASAAPLVGKKPRCFGDFEPTDEENCGQCSWKESCKKGEA